MEKVWIPEQSTVAGAWCLSRLVMGSERWVSGGQLQGEASYVLWIPWALESHMWLYGELKWLYPELCFGTVAGGSEAVDGKAG